MQYHRPLRLHYRVRDGNGCGPQRIDTATAPAGLSADRDLLIADFQLSIANCKKTFGRSFCQLAIVNRQLEIMNIEVALLRFAFARRIGPFQARDKCDQAIAR